MNRDKRYPKPPSPCATRHRRWRVWYDFGEMGGHETSWRAAAPGNVEQLEAKGFLGLLAGIDAIEDARGHDLGERLVPAPIVTDQRWRLFDPAATFHVDY